MKFRNIIREDIRRAVAKKTPHLDNAGSKQYDTVELTPDVVEELEAAFPDRRAVKVMPHKQGGGIDKAIELLKVSHPMSGSTSGETGAHAFEMINVNEEISFQFVMSEADYQGRIARQLETFYPDSHVEVSELSQPEILPLYPGWHFGMCHLELREQASAKERMKPIKHPDVEGFEDDPLGSITREMVGERESPQVTNVAVQVIFQPAANDWYDGGVVAPSVDQAADWLARKQNQPSLDMKELAKTFTDNTSLFDLSGSSSTSDTPASAAIRNQRGHKGFKINVRIMAVGESPEEVVSRVDDTADMYIGYYDSDTEQGFRTYPADGSDLLTLSQLVCRREYVDRKMTMGERAAAALIHLPNKNSNTQNVTFSHTSNAGDVPPNHPRFDSFDATGWDRHDRTVTLDPDAWEYEITQRQPTEEEFERAKEIERAEARGEIEKAEQLKESV